MGQWSNDLQRIKDEQQKRDKAELLRQKVEEKLKNKIRYETVENGAIVIKYRNRFDDKNLEPFE